MHCKLGNPIAHPGIIDEGSKLSGFIVDPTEISVLLVEMMNRKPLCNFFWLYKATDRLTTRIGKKRTDNLGIKGITDEIRSRKCKPTSRTP